MRENLDNVTAVIFRDVENEKKDKESLYVELLNIKFEKICFV